jgi:AraC-like DNA-binding protein
VTEQSTTPTTTAPLLSLLSQAQAHRRSLGAVSEPVNDVAIGRPAPPLRPFVERYTGYRLQGFEPGTHRGLPGRHLTFIISLSDPVQIAAMPDPRQPPAALGAFVSGLHDGPATIAHDGNQYGIGLDLTPAGARALLGLPAGELAGLVVGLDAFLGRRAEHLVDRLASAPTWAVRFAQLDEVLLDLAARVETPPPRPEVVRAWELLVLTGGSVEVGSLAAELGWSRRHLGERFRAEIGLAPKAAARVVRFERARLLLQRPHRPSLAEVAAATGYYDQAHLNRDWRDLAGCSPTVWLAEELPPVQDPTAVSDAG